MFRAELTKQHLSTRIYLGYILYIQKYHPEVDLERLCQDCGLSLDHIKNQNNWVSVVFDLEFMSRVNQLIKVENIESVVGAFSVSRECIGPFYVLGEHVLPLSGLYSQVVSYGPRLNRVVNFEVKKHRGRNVVVKISPNPEGLSPEELNALQKIFPSIVRSMRGYYSAFPKIKRLPNAQVKLGVDGDCVEFDIKYPIDRFSFVQTFFSLFTAPFFIALGWVLGFPILVTIAVTATLLLVLTSIFLFKRNQGLEDLTEENEAQNREVNETNKKLQESNSFLQMANTNLLDSNEKLQRQLAVSTTTSKIANYLVEEGSRNEILNSIAQEFARGLGYDRVIVLLVNADRQLEFAAGALDNSPFAHVVRTQKFDTELPSDDPAKIGNIFKNRRSVLIEDVKSHMAGLSQEGRQLFELSHSKSFLAVPIFTESENLGVLMADNAISDRKLTRDDLRNAETCAFQVGAVLQRLEAEREAKESQAHAERLARAASRFVPDDMIELLGCSSVTDVELGLAREHELAIMFTDIRGFTGLSETMTPSESAAFLLSYYRNHGPSISHFNGMVDKLLGDGILALFKDVDDALKSSIDFQKQLQKYNVFHRSGGTRRLIKSGIGLHFEKVRVASIGFENHLSVTVVASGVNYASRLDELNKKFGTDALCSAQFYNLLTNRAELRFVGHIQARGQANSNDVYEIIGHKDPASIELAKKVEPQIIGISKAIREGEIEEARNFIQRGLEISPADTVLQSYQEKLLEMVREVQTTRKAS